jgi:hypothetical protein
MNKFFIVVILTFLGANLAEGNDVYVNGYVRKDGVYVQPYVRTSPDNTVNNNYGTQGNYNPYNGKWGTKPQNPNETGYNVYSGSNAYQYKPLSP